MSKKVVVVGGGASGMAAAITAKERGLDVILLEKKEVPGKKLSVTGNGRCNFTNGKMTADCYFSHQVSAASRFVEAHPAAEVLDFFSGLQVLYTERNGYYYPKNNQARTIVSALTERLKALQVDVRVNTTVTDLKTDDRGGFTVVTESGKIPADAVILASGSKASVKEPDRFSAYSCLRKFGHRVYPVLPSLVKLTGNSGAEKFWDGVRLQGRITLKKDEKDLIFEEGELQFVKDGISGIPVFQVSHVGVSEISASSRVEASVDFLPEYAQDEIEHMLQVSAKDVLSGEMKLEQLLSLWIPQKLVLTVLKEARVSHKQKVIELTKENISRVAGVLKNYPYTFTGYGDFSAAQTVQGGVDLSEVTEDFESRLVKNLFITGELLDMDGKCGGYNLQFAFASGMTAGKKVLK